MKEFVKKLPANLFSKEYLFDYLFAHFQHEDEVMVKNLLKRTEKTKKQAKEDFKSSFAENNVIFTNHTYIYVLKRWKKMNLSEYVLIFDELHEIENMWELIIKKTFSIFRLKNLINLFLYKINPDSSKRGYKEFIKCMKKAKDNCQRLLNSKSFLGREGIIYTNKTEKGREKINKLIEYVNKNIIGAGGGKKNIIARLNEVLNNGFDLSKEAYRVLWAIKKEFQEYYEIRDSIDQAIIYSRKKGYPSLDSYSVDVRRDLKKFWGSLEDTGTVIGMSATLLLDTDSREQILKEIGFTGDLLSKAEIREYGINFFKKETEL